MSIFSKLFGSNNYDKESSGVPDSSSFFDYEDDEAASSSYECPNCHDDMEYSGRDYGGGYLYSCATCGNIAHELDGGVYFDFDPDDDYDNTPAGCRACGGDYPNCASSCNLMSD